MKISIYYPIPTRRRVQTKLLEAISNLILKVYPTYNVYEVNAFADARDSEYVVTLSRSLGEKLRQHAKKYPHTRFVAYARQHVLKDGMAQKVSWQPGRNFLLLGASFGLEQEAVVREVFIPF